MGTLLHSNLSALVDLVNRIDGDLMLAWSEGAKPTTYWITPAERELLRGALVPESQIDRLTNPADTSEPKYHYITTQIGRVTLIVSEAK